MARRVGLAGTGVLVAAMVTAQVGAVDFVALVAPQVARRLVRTERPPLLCAALLGALLLVLADLAGRRLFAPDPTARRRADRRDRRPVPDLPAAARPAAALVTPARSA